MSEPPPLAIAAGVSKGYDLPRVRIEVLRSVDLEVSAGEFVVVRGASGAGKSTLLHLLGGLDQPDSGEVRIRGEPLQRISAARRHAYRNRLVGFIFQGFHLLPELDAVENVALPARIARVGEREARRRADGLLRRVGLGHRLNHRPGELSGGEQQRVAIARSLVNAPPLLLADEPTGNLDSKTGAAVLALLLELRAEYGVALVIATHDHGVASRAGRVLALADGRLGPE